MIPAGTQIGVKLLTLMVAYMQPLFLGLRNCEWNSLVLVLQASRRHQKLAVLFSYNQVVSDLQCALRIDELSMGSVL